jgi:acyl-coenzyme A synthetase/AMP-(fatty) acid ligase
VLLGSLQHGSCTVQPPRIDFSPDELVDMIHRCALNRLLQFASFLANTLRSAKGDPKLLALLRDLDQVTYSGAALPRDEEVWAYRNGIKLRVCPGLRRAVDSCSIIPQQNLFGSTESGAMMLSVGDSGPFAPLLRPLDGVSYGFFPVASQFQPGLRQGSPLSIVELVILAESGDCPHPSLRHADGQFHTGDLFQEVHPGLYIPRGRDDDWIKSANGLRCDTKSVIRFCPLSA